MRLRPSDVFTPARLPLAETNVYAPRDSELEIETAFSLHRTPVIFGDYGVGKTSTIVKIAQVNQGQWEYLHFQATGRKEFSDFFRAFLEKQEYKVTKHVRETSAEAGGSLFSLFALKGQHKDQITDELLVSSPTDDRILDIMNERRRFFIIDELHKASKRFKEDLADFMKSLVDRQLDHVRLAIVGTVHEPSELVKYDEGVRRIVQEVKILPMNERESAYLIRTGMEKCELVIDRRLVHRIFELSGGSPSVIHQLCLSCANQALSAGTDAITTRSVDLAVDDLLKGRLTQHNEIWMQIAERTGDVRWRKHILFAMAQHDSEIISTEELSQKLAQLLDRPVKSSDYSSQLRTLHEKFNVISRVPDGKSGSAFALWRFKDPSFKNFINVVWRREKTQDRTNQLA